MLTLILLVPGALSFWLAAAREDRVHEWYYLFALPGLAILVALGLGCVFAWVRRPRLSMALTAALMVVALAGYTAWSQVPREALLRGSLQPLRESVLLTRGTLDPFAPENDGVITTSFKRGPTYYDPRLIVIQTVPELRKLMRRADRTGAVLYVNLGKPASAKWESPDLFALVEDPSAFEVFANLYGYEPRGIRTIYRYRGRQLRRSEASAPVDADRQQSGPGLP